MTRILFTTIIILFSAGLFSSEVADQGISGYGIEEARTDSIFYIYTDEEFKKAVFETIQKNSLTNPKLFLKTLNEVKLGKIEKKEREYGVENISKEYSPGLNGWTITISGMLVVFVGLILILISIHIFNFFFKSEKKEKQVLKTQLPSEIKNTTAAEEIPEEHLIAIATAVELYKRLYLVNSMGSLTFKHSDSRSWKIVNKFGQR
jgi:Na+-transporting methylmalonyl-CoA/oxaloacetate decarboxylase gamma subunit